jgi:hypothetical protein
VKNPDKSNKNQTGGITMAQAMKQENYQHYADLNSSGNPPAFPDGALLRSTDADRPAWRVISKRGIDCFFKTMREAQDFCQQHGYSFVCPIRKGG